MKLYLLILIIFSLLIFYLCINNLYQIDTFYNFESQCKQSPLLEQVMTELDNKNDNSVGQYFIPCEYNTCEAKVIEFEKDKNSRKLFLIDGCDWVASKIDLWRLLKIYYGANASSYMMPTTHLLDNVQDMKDFKIHFENKNKEHPGHMFVLKNYAQRQEGIKIVNTMKDILDGYKNGFYLVQDYLYNPFLVNKRKVNFRYYTLIVCETGKPIRGYIHRDGFVYYTPEFYDANSIDFDKHITTGYIDRKVYDTNPLTLDDFRTHLDKLKPNLSKQWDANVRTLMHNVVKALATKVCKNPKLAHHTRFQLFGSDVAPTADLNAYLMEINKGPDLNAKDERDKLVKLAVQRDMFKILSNEINQNTRFEKIY